MSYQLAHPLDFFNTLNSRFNDFYWVHDSHDEASLGTIANKKVVFKKDISSEIHLYINGELELTQKYSLESNEGKKIQALINQVKNHNAIDNNIKYQTMYANTLLMQSILTINRYFNRSEIVIGK